VLQEEGDDIYLTVEELKTIEKKEIPAHLEKYRDIFLIGAWTGLRFSDFTRVTKENIINKFGNQYIKIKTKKTGEDVVIPVLPPLARILHKYPGLLPTVSEQKFNKYIKDICQLAEIDEPTEITISKGLLKTRKFVPKYKLVSSHTCRRSFCTNAFLEFEIEPINIMKISGHRTQRAFLRYIKADKFQTANIFRIKALRMLGEK
jgi:integrase